MHRVRVTRIPVVRADHRIRLARPPSGAHPVRVARSVIPVRRGFCAHPARVRIVAPASPQSRAASGRPRPHRAGAKRGRTPARRWRRHGHRAQVSAIATILGLLLVVTFVANYLATTLPNQMSANDLNHELQVENQIGHFTRALQSVSTGAAIGAPLAQPISLGSAGAPPFASPDGGSISAIRGQPNASVSFGMLGTQYYPPTGWVQYPYTGACTASPNRTSPTSINCLGQGTYTNVTYNFAGSSNYNFSVGGKGGSTFDLNFSTNNSVINVSATGGANVGTTFVIGVVGNHNSISFTAEGGANFTILIVGNNNQLFFSAQGKSSHASAVIAGNYNSVSPSIRTDLVRVWGSYDTVSPQSGYSTVYFNSFDPQNPVSPLCPYSGPLTDRVISAGGGGFLTYNNTNLNNSPGKTGLSPYAPYPTWTTFMNTPPLNACIFFLSFPTGGRGATAASFVVELQNTYAPGAEVAFDQGAVVYAQPGAYPILIDPPPVAFSHGIATVWLPAFLQPVSSEAGIGTAIVSTHLVSAQRLTFPSGGWYPNPGQPVTLVYATPYGFAWNHSSFADSLRASGATIGCTPEPSVACDGPYEPGGPLGTVTIRLPATMLTLDLAVFSVTLQ